MEMFLMALALSLLGVTVSAIAFAAAAKADAGGPERESRIGVEPVAEGHGAFFIEQPALAPQVPIEALLLQIERHVRLEHAAAEAFQQAPTPELLHIRTASPLVH